MSNHSPNLRLEFHGAAGAVTGSKHLLIYGDGGRETRVLLDAGLFQGPKKLRRRNWSKPGFDPESIDHVLISHTHIDHIGYLPRLVKTGLKAPVHMTPAAYDLAELMLLDSAKIQEEDARWANKKKFSKHNPALPLYTSDDAQAALDLRSSTPWNEWLDLADGLRARFWNAGHILGSSFLEIRAQVEGREIKIVFSGDIGRFDMPLHLDPDPRPDCDVLIVESTYGNRMHTTESVVDQVAQPFRDALARGGVILIPAFAVGRSQQVTLMLRRMMRAGQLPEVPIHIDSPMAVDATSIYSRHLNRRNLDADVFEDGRLRLFPEKVELHRSVRESKKLNALPGPRIIVSPSGMMTAGRVLHHFVRLAKDRRNLVVMAGFQAEGTRSRAMIEGARTVKVHGQEVAVRCHVMSIHGLSGHADRGELLRWVGSAGTSPYVSFMVHGEPPASHALAGAIHEHFGCETRMPKIGDGYDLLPFLEGERPRPKAVQEAEAANAVDADASEGFSQDLTLSLTSDLQSEDELAERSRLLLQSPAYARADRDPNLLQRDEMRATRLSMEYLKVELAMRDKEVEGTIAVFGGARIRDPETAARELEEAQAEIKEAPDDAAAKRALALAERRLERSRYYEVARDLGQIVGRLGGPECCRLVSLTGGGPGIMEAVNRGAFEVGSPTVGLNITLPHEQAPNPYITEDLCFQFRYFALRKMHFLLRAKAMIAFPGGFGTFDELFETLCLVQTRTIDPLPIILVGEDFWRRTVDFEALADEGVIGEHDLELFTFAETAEEIWKQIQDWYEANEMTL